MNMYESENGKKNTVSAQNQLSKQWSVEIVETKKAAMKVLFVGNSITRHAPKEEIGWSGDWGMAASCKEKDYVHQVIARLKEQYGNISYCIAQAAKWEKEYWKGIAVHKEEYRRARSFAADLVIIRIGENIPHNKNEEIDCKQYFNEMIRFFTEENPDAKVVVTDCFWRYDKLDNAIREIALERGYYFCKISDLEQDSATMALGEYAHEGVAVHPGDFGMSCIADRILKVLGDVLSGDEGKTSKSIY